MLVHAAAGGNFGQLVAVTDYRTVYERRRREPRRRSRYEGPNKVSTRLPDARSTRQKD